MNASKQLFCEDCRWRMGCNNCDAPQNRIIKNGHDLVSRSSQPASYSYRWQTCSFQRGIGFIESLVLRCCGRRGRWFVSAAQKVNQ